MESVAFIPQRLGLYLNSTLKRQNWRTLAVNAQHRPIYLGVK